MGGVDHNALKHASASHAEVTDNGRGAAPAAERSEGTGTIGMRERVTLFGGELQVGPRPQGGYAVRVCLPTSAEEP